MSTVGEKNNNFSSRSKMPVTKAKHYNDAILFKHIQKFNKVAFIVITEVVNNSVTKAILFPNSPLCFTMAMEYSDAHSSFAASTRSFLQ
jgi:hypothetical protein